VTEEQRNIRYLPERLYPMGSHHRKEIEAHFILRSESGAQKLLASLRDVQTTFLCFTNRAGSNYLTELLYKVGFGVRVAEEDFNSSSAIAASKLYHMPAFDEYLAYVVKETERNGTLFCKIGSSQLFWLADQGFLSDFFPRAKFVFIRRRDKIAQAVSLYLAKPTGRYSDDIPGTGPVPVPVPVPVFDKVSIAEDLRFIIELRV
jgi:LPS sulfotransferase NodH